MLKPQRGKTLPVRIGRTADGKELLKLGVAKHSKHNADEITQSSPLAHKLPYPDQGPRSGWGWGGFNPPPPLFCKNKNKLNKK